NRCDVYPLCSLPRRCRERHSAMLLQSGACPDEIESPPPLSAVVPAKAGTQYPRALVVAIERFGWVSVYWVPAFAGTTAQRTLFTIKNYACSEIVLDLTCSVTMLRSSRSTLRGAHS